MSCCGSVCGVWAPCALELTLYPWVLFQVCRCSSPGKLRNWRKPCVKLMLMLHVQPTLPSSDKRRRIVRGAEAEDPRSPEWPCNASASKVYDKQRRFHRMHTPSSGLTFVQYTAACISFWMMGSLALCQPSRLGQVCTSRPCAECVCKQLVVSHFCFVRASGCRSSGKRLR
jgi:hypothetical protein